MNTRSASTPAAVSADSCASRSWPQELRRCGGAVFDVVRCGTSGLVVGRRSAGVVHLVAAAYPFYGGRPGAWVVLAGPGADEVREPRTSPSTASTGYTHNWTTTRYESGCQPNHSLIHQFARTTMPPRQRGFASRASRMPGQLRPWDLTEGEKPDTSIPSDTSCRMYRSSSPDDPQGRQRGVGGVGDAHAGAARLLERGEGCVGDLLAGREHRDAGRVRRDELGADAADGAGERDAFVRGEERLPRREDR